MATTKTSKAKKPTTKAKTKTVGKSVKAAVKTVKELATKAGDAIASVFHTDTKEQKKAATPAKKKAPAAHKPAKV